MTIPLGYWNNTFKEPLKYPGNAHGIVCGPTRSGKFRDILCQILLSYTGSMFVIDNKAQAASVTARYRRDVLGQEVYVLNPFNILPEYIGGFSHAEYDPVTSQLDPLSDTFAADADTLYEGIMPLGGPETHWVHSARALGSGITMALRELGLDASLPDALAMIGGKDLFAFCKNVLTYETLSEHTRSRLGRYAEDNAPESKEISSVISSALTAMNAFANKPIAENMRKSTVDLRMMKHKPMTIYVIVPGRYVKAASAWTRIITNSWVDACLHEGIGNVPVMGLLDEFATTVKNLDGINTLNAMGAGYGCQLLTVIQDLNQLKTLMPDGWQTYLANAAYQVYFAPGPGDLFTADHLSRMCGSIEVPTTSRSVGDATTGPFQMPGGALDGINQMIRKAVGQNTGVQVSIGQQTKRYMQIEDVVDMADDQMLVFGRGIKGVIKAARRPYFKDPNYAGRYDKDPYER